ncbi:hypothetical protein [Streptomyces viridosporus]|uniref:Uncharacterized protein n=1 Tax=Streptomyces viridosporus T7A TaxID=665577 RepID=A0ABX6ACG1_STRVD|nr:hypothetical protein [Streptomyces viridosporus]QEU85461.1 hypothetical protein CP969_12570 [Streptomyces viridosporus T7A]
MARPMINPPSEEDLPPGPLRDLTVELHRLYVSAGRPSLRKISERVKENDDAPTTVSHERVRQLLVGGAESASRDVVIALVMALIDMVHPRPDPGEERERFLLLWHAMTGDVRPPGAAEPAPTGRRDIGARPDITPALGSVALALRFEHFAHRSARDIATRLCYRQADDDVEGFLKSFVQMTDVMSVVDLIAQLRMASLHEMAEWLIDLAVENLPFFDLVDLVLLFYKQRWRVHVLLTAIARRRTPQEVDELMGWIGRGRKDDAEKLRRLFRELRSQGEDDELDSLQGSERF